MNALLEVAGLGVRFGGLVALEEFALSVAAGEVHGIIGPNGAGKTTAINALTGFLSRQGGSVRFAGQALPAVPHLVARAGIGRSFQSPSIFPGLSAVQNVMAGGHGWTRAGVLRSVLGTAQMRAEEATLRASAGDWLRQVGFAAPPEAPVLELPFGELRKLEIARALMARPRLLLLDEPTAGLTAEEVVRIGQLLRRVRLADGAALAVVLIEHNVPFVFSLCDRVTALDKGGIIACGSPAEVRRDAVVIDSYLGQGARPAGTGAATPPAARPAADAPVILDVRGLAAGYGRLAVVRDFTLRLRQGELLVLCGRNGAGKSTILNALTGQPRPSAGEVHWLGRRIDGRSVSAIVRAGIGLVPQERGVIAGQSVLANLRLSTIGLGLGRRELATRCAEMLARFPKLGQRRDQLAGTLSGGERQMLALAKVLIRRPRLLLLDEPSIGLAPTIVDELQRIVADISAAGMSLVVAEQNVAWVAPIATRACLLEGGRIVAEGQAAEMFAREQMSEAYLGRDLAPAGAN